MLTVVDATKVPYVPVSVITDVPADAPAEPRRLNVAGLLDVSGLAVKFVVQPVGMPLKLYVMATGPPVTPAGVRVTATAAVATPYSSSRQAATDVPIAYMTRP